MRKRGNNMPKFRKKPLEIEARNYESPNVAYDLVQWINKDRYRHLPVAYVKSSKKIAIPTLEGTMKANIGDWIIKGITGEFYACKSDVFELTYDEIKGENNE